MTDNEATPMLAVTDDDMSDEELIPGKLIDCPSNCGQQHEVLDGNPPGILQFYKCGESTYLVGLKNRRMKKKVPKKS